MAEDCWPIYINIYKDFSLSKDDGQTIFTLRVIWHRNEFNTNIASEEFARESFKEILPELSKLTERNCRKIIIHKKLKAADAPIEAIEWVMKISEIIKNMCLTNGAT